MNKYLFLFFGIFLISYSSSAQLIEISPRFSKETFDLNELKDSSYKNIKVWKHTQEFLIEEKNMKLDKSIIYELKFDDNFNVIYEFQEGQRYGYDSIKNVYIYDNFNHLISEVVMYYSNYNGNDSIVTNFEYDNQNILKTSKEYNTKRNTNKYKKESTYDKYGNIIKSHTKYDDGSKINYFFEYNKNGKILRRFKEKNKPDYEYFYDEKSRLIKEYKFYYGSELQDTILTVDTIIYKNTYDYKDRIISGSTHISKTFNINHPLCGRGPKPGDYSHFYIYDSLLNNLEFIDDSNIGCYMKFNGLFIVPPYRSDCEFKYKENGFEIIKYYDSASTLPFTSIFLYSLSQNGFSIEETFEEGKKMTEFLGSGSKLPEYIYIADGNYYSKSVYVIEYSK